jgi:hypothetical protein
MAKRTKTDRQTAWEERQREREAGWRRHLATWRAGSTTQASYCRRHGLAPADFSWWKYELARRDGREATGQIKPGFQAQPRFVPIQLKTGQESPVCELQLRNGRRLRIENGVDVRWVAELAAALECEVPC